MICLPDNAARHLAALNRTRAAYGVNPLRISAPLQEAAVVKSIALASADYFKPDHTEPGGRKPQRLAEDYGYQTQGGWVGENLLWGTADPDDALEVWMNSPAHRDNLLSKNYKVVGIAIGEEGSWDYQGDVYAVGVQLFGTADYGADVPLCSGQQPKPEPDRPPDNYNGDGEEWYPRPAPAPESVTPPPGFCRYRTDCPEGYRCHRLRTDQYGVCVLDTPVEARKPRRRRDLGRKAKLPDSGPVVAQEQRMRLLRRILEGMFR